jgi:hypothetical protein
LDSGRRARLGRGHRGQALPGLAADGRLDPGEDVIRHRRVRCAGQRRSHDDKLLADSGALLAPADVGLDPGGPARP